MLQPPPQFDRVRQVAVVPQRQFSLVAVNQDRLRVHQRRIARRRIPRVPDRRRAPQPRDHLRREYLLHVPQASVECMSVPSRRSDPRRFLPAMLQRVEPQIGELRRLRMPVHPEHAAVIVKMIVPDLYELAHAARVLARVFPANHRKQQPSRYRGGNKGPTNERDAKFASTVGKKEYGDDKVDDRNEKGQMMTPEPPL